MQFFTLEWWHGIQSGDFTYNPHEHYRSFLATIRDQLPKQLLVLQDSASLHDRRLRKLELSIAHGSLLLVVDGDDGSGGFRRFTLHYNGVSSLKSVADPSAGFARSNGYGDWGYDELDITEAGPYEHRVLFSSGIEIVVTVTSFELM
jgi:hypothetical protein